MIGTLLNAGAILGGGFFGVSSKKDLSQHNQLRLKGLLGALTVYVGLNTVWVSVNGSVPRVIKQLGIVLLALLAGNATGRLLRLQKAVSHLGHSAAAKFSKAANSKRFHNTNEALAICAVFFCVSPMSVLGAVQDGLAGDCRTLAIKAALDGFSAVAFARVLGGGVLLSAIPVLAWQGTLTLLFAALKPWLEGHHLLDAILATAGLLTTLLCLVIFDVKKVPMADYLPSLIYAPLITAWWR